MRAVSHGKPCPMARYAALAELVRTQDSSRKSRRADCAFPVMKGHEDGGKCSVERREALPPSSGDAFEPILRKEVIQPQVPLRLPCYDFTPVAKPTVVACLPCGLAQRLRVNPTPMV